MPNKRNRTEIKHQRNDNHDIFPDTRGDRSLSADYNMRSPSSFPANTYCTGHTFTAREVLGQTSGMDHSYIDWTPSHPEWGETPPPLSALQQMYHCVYASVCVSPFHFSAAFVCIRSMRVMACRKQVSERGNVHAGIIVTCKRRLFYRTLLFALLRELWILNSRVTAKFLRRFLPNTISESNV